MDEDTFVRLLQMDKQSVYAIFKAAWIDYMGFLANIGNDIYNSCIEDYYASYTPTKYDRHGNLAGENLYQANLIQTLETDINIDIDPFQLWQYKAKKDVRQKVLNGVLTGLRGVGSFKNAASGWPRSWTTSYPNKYSIYSDWSSNSTTIDGIITDFLSDSTIDETIDYLWNAFVSRI